mgnify:CR=1 FL=1
MKRLFRSKPVTTFLGALIWAWMTLVARTVRPELALVRILAMTVWSDLGWRRIGQHGEKRVHTADPLFWYGNEALSLSSQSSSVTSLLLNKSDVREVRVGAGASAITEIMARNQ